MISAKEAYSFSNNKLTINDYVVDIEAAIAKASKSGNKVLHYTLPEKVSEQSTYEIKNYLISFGYSVIVVLPCRPMFNRCQLNIRWDNA